MAYQDKKTIWGIVACALMLLMVYAIAILNPAMFASSLNQNDFDSAPAAVQKIPEMLVQDSEPVELSNFDTPSLDTGVLNGVVPRKIIGPEESNSAMNISDSVKVQGLNEATTDLAYVNVEELKMLQKADIDRINEELKKLDSQANMFDDPTSFEALQQVLANESAPEEPSLQSVIDELNQTNSENLTFKFGELVLSEQAEEIVSTVAKRLNSNSQISMQIKNYTDSYGDNNFNLNLSRQRAEVVYKAFLDNGVSQSQITYEGLGEANPIVSNDTLAGRRKNRRTELTFSASK